MFTNFTLVSLFARRVPSAQSSPRTAALSESLDSLSPPCTASPDLGASLSRSQSLYISRCFSVSWLSLAPPCTTPPDLTASALSQSRPISRRLSVQTQCLDSFSLSLPGVIAAEYLSKKYPLYFKSYLSLYSCDLNLYICVISVFESYLCFCCFWLIFVFILIQILSWC